MDTFRALADPTRRDIVALLAKGERTAGEIFARFDIADPTVSRHLKVLRESGLIAYRQEAQPRTYRLEAGRARRYAAMDAGTDRSCRSRFDRLGAHLDRMKRRRANVKDE